MAWNARTAGSSLYVCANERHLFMAYSLCMFVWVNYALGKEVMSEYRSYILRQGRRLTTFPCTILGRRRSHYIRAQDKPLDITSTHMLMCSRSFAIECKHTPSECSKNQRRLCYHIL